MRNRVFAIATIAVLLGVFSASVTAQGRMQGRGMMNHAGQSAAQDSVTLVGIVTAANLAAGQGMPTITLRTSSGDVTVLVGPYRNLMDSKFTISIDQKLQVEAFLDPRVANAYKATRITDTATGVSVDLSTPGRGMSMGMGRGAGGVMRGIGNCAFAATPVDLKNKTLLTGTVQSVNLNPGKNPPTITISAAGGVVTVAVCPLQAVRRANFQISVSDYVSVVAYPLTNSTGFYLAAEINNSTTQKSIKIRDENGLPITVRGAGPGACAICFN